MIRAFPTAVIGIVEPRFFDVLVCFPGLLHYFLHARVDVVAILFEITFPFLPMLRLNEYCRRNHLGVY